jgi:hypothetical protein
MWYMRRPSGLQPVPLLTVTSGSTVVACPFGAIRLSVPPPDASS